MERWRRGGGVVVVVLWVVEFEVDEDFFFFFGIWGQDELLLVFLLPFHLKKKKTLDFVSFLFFGLSSLFNSAISNHFSSNQKKNMDFWLFFFLNLFLYLGKKKTTPKFPHQKWLEKKNQKEFFLFWTRKYDLFWMPSCSTCHCFSHWTTFTRWK